MADRITVLERNTVELASMPVAKLLAKYFMPSFAGVMVNALYNIVDRIFIGQAVGSLALAGLSAVLPIMLIQSAFSMLLGIGGAVRNSLALGRQDYRAAERLLGHTFVLMLLVGFGIMGFGFLARTPLLQMFGVGDTTMKYAMDYLNVILLASPLSVMGFALTNFIRSEGNARIAMTSLFISAGLNIMLDALFILGFGWGVRGAAWATFLSQLVLAVWVLAHFRSTRSVIRLRWQHLGFSRDVTLAVITVGFSPFAMQLAASLVQASFNVQLVKYGSDYCMSAIGIINSVAQLLIMSLVALNQSAQPIYGYSMGAGLYSRVQECLKICFTSSIIIGIAGFVLVQSIPSTIIRLFDASDANLLAVGRRGIRIFFAAFPFAALQVVSGGYFQSVGKARISAFIALMRQVLFLIPLLFILPRWFELSGVWLAAPVADLLSGVVCTSLIIREARALNRRMVMAEV